MPGSEADSLDQVASSRSRRLLALRVLLEDEDTVDMAFFFWAWLGGRGL